MVHYIKKKALVHDVPTLFLCLFNSGKNEVWIVI